MPPENRPRLGESSPLYRFGLIGFGVLITAMLVVFLVQQWRQTYNLVKSVNDYSDFLGKHGMKSGKPQAQPKAITPPAGQAFEIEVDGKPVWVIYFDTSDKQQAEALSAIKTDPTLKIGGQSHPAKVHGSLVLVGYDGHPDEVKLLEALDEFDVSPKK